MSECDTAPTLPSSDHPPHATLVPTHTILSCLLIHLYIHTNVGRIMATELEVRFRRSSLVQLTGVHDNRDWVAKCLGQMTDMNRADVQAELKQVIGEAFAAHTLWTTDWAGVQLKRCRSLLYLSLSVLLLRYSDDKPHAEATPCV